MKFFLTYQRATEDEVQKLIAGIDDMRKPPTASKAGDTVGKAIREQYAAQFASEGGRSGAPWAQLRPRTVRDRMRQGYPGRHPILVRSGGYKDSWIERYDRAHFSQLNVTAHGWEYGEGSTDFRAAWMEHGTRYMVARPVRTALMRGNIAIIRALEMIYDAKWPGTRGKGKANAG